MGVAGKETEMGTLRLSDFYAVVPEWQRPDSNSNFCISKMVKHSGPFSGVMESSLLSSPPPLGFVDFVQVLH